jgi:glycosyltransferase involved in cell wall biosynthesis
MTERRLVGISRGSGYVPRTASGAALHLFDALARRYRLEARVDAELDRVQRVASLALAFHPVRNRWRDRYLNSPVGFALASRNAGRRLSVPDAVAVQVYGMFRTSGAPYVMYLDSTQAMAIRHWKPWSPYGRPGRAAWMAMERAAYRGAEHIFTAATPTARSVVEDYGVPAERVSVAGAGSNFFPLPAPRRRSHAPQILFMGREWERKGGPVLVRAFRRVRAELPEARLAIVGPELTLDEPGVEVVGRVRDREALAERFRAAAIYCVPSIFDPFTTSLMEGMAYSLPCVASTTAGVPELVLDGQTGLLVEPGDEQGLAAALLRLLRDPELGDRLGRAGRVRVEEELTWDRVAARMAPVLEGLGVVPLHEAITASASVTRPEHREVVKASAGGVDRVVT